MTQILEQEDSTKKDRYQLFYGLLNGRATKEKELGLDYTEYVLQYMGT